MRKEVKKLDSRVFKEFNSICEKYIINTSEDNLNSLLDIYQKLNPNWVDSLNKLNKRLSEESNIQDRMFDDFLKVELPEGYTVKDLKAPKNKNQDPLTDIMQRGRIIHLSNKIAHQFEFIFESRLKEYMAKNGISCNTKAEFCEVKRLIRKIYAPETKTKVKENAKCILDMDYGFESTDFEEAKNLDNLNFPALIKAYNDGMYLKAMEIENVNKLIHHHGKEEEVSYGLRKDCEENMLFVMDIQGFGQFSVHVKDPRLVAQIKTKYKMPLYKRETLMLVDHMSSTAEEFMEEAKTDDSMDEERDIPKYVSEERKQRARLLEEIKFLDLNRAEKHELAVKGGLLRRELEELDNAEEER